MVQLDDTENIILHTDKEGQHISSFKIRLNLPSKRKHIPNQILTRIHCCSVKVDLIATFAPEAKDNHEYNEGSERNRPGMSGYLLSTETGRTKSKHSVRIDEGLGIRTEK